MMPRVVPPLLLDLSPELLATELARAGLPPAQALRLLKSAFHRPLDRELEHASIGKAVLAWVRERFAFRGAELARRHVAADGTVKLLLALRRGGAVETVLLPSHRSDRAAGCLSSQVGCAMGCAFCASTRDGLQRNLGSGEIVEQFLHLRGEAARAGRRLNSLVFMGMGEPLLNLDAVGDAIRLLSRRELGGVSRRSITVSTVGIVPGIERLRDSGLRVHLALSLHAPDDATRGALIPSNRRWPVREIVHAAREYQRVTRRIVTIEYTLIESVNDAPGQAEALATLLRDWRVHVNVIPYNPVTGLAYRRPSPQRVGAFLLHLQQRGVVAHQRRSRGDDVDAACGQLRLRVLAGT